MTHTLYDSCGMSHILQCSRDESLIVTHSCEITTSQYEAYYTGTSYR